MPAASGIPLRIKGGIFLAALAVAIAFAWFTDHVWEDYYITYRSSKNLATGHGLVFNPGDKLHTFTSPLGVLLPAAAFALTGNTSDTGALWIFRVMSAAALAGAVVLLATLAARLRYAAWAAGFVVAALLLDAKILDFTINGMETAFMLLFLAHALWAHLHPGPRQWVHLGGAWAGLMWTRPDSFIYVGLVGIGFWLFNDAASSGHNRRSLIVLYLKAGLLTTALYLPWLLWAWWYYGSPVPHTIVAKGTLSAHKHTLENFLNTALKLPWLAWQGQATLELTWLPSYHMLGGWPKWFELASRAAATLGCLLWLVPGLRREARAASFAFFGAHVYLTCFPYFPFPWYVPPTTLLGVFALAGLLAQAIGTGAPIRRLTRPAALAGAVLFLGVSTWATLAVARQVEAQQRLVENGVRKAAGEWLRVHAKPGDTVAMEPLGYIGYFSGLKTYDYPGMSSREMVAARARQGEDWIALVSHLEPDWLVLRQFEVERIHGHSPTMLKVNYEPAQEFNQLEAVQRSRVRGQAYLEHDARFTVFRRIGTLRYQHDGAEMLSPFSVAGRFIDGRFLYEVHAPGLVIVDIPPGARRASGWFGFNPLAIETDWPTDGARFIVEYRSAGHTTAVHHRTLEPAKVPADLPLQSYEVELPEGLAPGAVLLLRTEIKGHNVRDWTCWSIPVFR